MAETDTESAKAEKAATTGEAAEPAALDTASDEDTASDQDNASDQDSAADKTEEAATAAPAGRTPAQEGPRPKGIGPIGWLRWAWRQLTTMRTALILLFMVALGAIPSSFLPQRGQAPEKVAAYFQQHKALAPWLDRFSLFDVFAAPWFVAIYILLFVSLAGCVLPRLVKHFRAMRAQPPAAPRNLARLPQSATFETTRTPDEVLAEARALLKKRRFRVADGTGSVASEKGYVGELGNLMFHLALLGLLFSLGVGNLFGYRGDVLLREGSSFANTLAQYDQFKPGRAFDTGELSPFSITLDDFQAKYELKGEKRGQATDFHAAITYRDTPDGPQKHYNLKVNHPLKIGGTKVYLLGHGYAPQFTVRDGKGQVAFRGAVPFLPQNPRTLQSEGVIKVPDAQPTQLAFYAILWPTATATSDGKQIVSEFPAALRPVISIVGFKGDLGLDSGNAQSVYQLEGLGKTLNPIKRGEKLMEPGETFKLPDGSGSITFEGMKEWTSLSVNHDPGRVPALAAAVLAILGVIASFTVRRRRVWVRASAAEDGRTVVHVGGLTLGNPTPEFDDVVAALRGTPQGSETSEPTTPVSEETGTPEDAATGDKSDLSGAETSTSAADDPSDKE
ncbi:cytochrome c biogenesis protein ResB [Actinomadura harenae]|uniref:Cytochrome c biogenesis protein ResB n=1 Tax=Actinomadura harenae TaxID=2483351 RepID=A0A3M2MJW0_9ACTN|nr:cytochrome c biogenesis protein ResB [Actinomadura harenae]RMI47668.1 cytochrome c biogenesis protein ResB [Actinomadura harenae]